MTRHRDVALTALAPMVWGSSYIVTTESLPGVPPLVVVFLRALPAGLLLLLVTRNLPPRTWIPRILILGTLNFALFWGALFVAAYRLPGGMAATLGAVQPLFVVLLGTVLVATPVTGVSLLGGIAGLIGVALLVLGPEAQADPIGIGAALFGALSMALGTVLSRRWQPPVPPLTFAAWQLTAGGIVLMPFALLSVGDVPPLGLRAFAGLAWLSLVGGALTYVLFFRGIARLGPARVANLGFLSPLSAVLLGWINLGEALTPLQVGGAVIVLLSIWLTQNFGPPPQTPQTAMSKAAERRVLV